MTYQSGGLVDHQQLLVFMNNLEELDHDSIQWLIAKAGDQRS
jgi:hypothetical protein